MALISVLDFLFEVHRLQKIEKDLRLIVNNVHNTRALVNKCTSVQAYKCTQVHKYTDCKRLAKINA